MIVPETTYNIGAPPDIFHLGHPAIAELLSGEVQVEEKVDGSQFAFCRTQDGVFHARSRKQQIVPESAGMFQKAVDALIDLPLHPDYIYRGEYLSKPKHNALAYDRVPNRFVILYDIKIGPEAYLNAESRKAEAARLGLEVVPVLRYGTVTKDDLEVLLTTPSILGGQTIEGIVVKNYSRFGPDKKVLMGKWVRPEFKEIAKASWKLANPGQGNILTHLAQQLCTEARWQKAVQHLRELELLSHEPKDIGKLIAEIQNDVKKECGEMIRHELFEWAWTQLRRRVIAGFPEWYKEQLRAKLQD